MFNYTFTRQFRTSASEGYSIMESGERVGRVDIHFAMEKVFATIVLEKYMLENEVGELIELIDTNLVESASVRRDDLNVWVYQGSEVGFFTDETTYPEDFDDEENDAMADNELNQPIYADPLLASEDEEKLP